MAGPFTLAVHMPFTPTSSLWLNLVERWFHELTDKALRGGVFHSVPDLITRIEGSKNTSKSTTTTRNHSSGRQPPTTSSPKSPVDVSHSTQSTNVETDH